MTDDEINQLITMVSNEPSDAELRAFARAIVAKEREWQGLTMEDIAELRLKGAYALSDKDAFAVDAKLKEKNS